MGEHFRREIGGEDLCGPPVQEHACQVQGTGAQVQDLTLPMGPQCGDGDPPPGLVEPKAEYTVGQVIAGGQVVEHLPHSGCAIGCAGCGSKGTGCCHAMRSTR